MSNPRFLMACAISFSIAISGNGLLHGQSSSRVGGGVQYAAPTAEDIPEESSGVLPASWPSLPMPKVTMPRITLPKVTLPQWPKLWPAADGSNRDGNDSSSPALLAPIAAGGRKISAGTKKAWEGAKDILSFGGEKKASPQRNTANPKPSFWNRMFGPAEPPPGPQTIGDWMSQPRLDP